MATRAITTNQPDVSCDVCGRRLLRGERPDVFLASGSRRTVCELCIPRATEEGWMRESEAMTVAGARGPRSRRGRSLLDRLRQRRGEEQRPSVLDSSGAIWLRDQGSDPSRVRADGWQDAPAGGWAPDEDYWSGERAEAPLTGERAEPPLTGERAEAPLTGERAEAPLTGEGTEAPLTGEGGEPPSAKDAYEPMSNGSRGPAAYGMREGAARAAGVRGTAVVQPGADIPAVQAVEIFNASECATRVAGIARALGEPGVTVGVAAEDEDRVRVVVAWELCWYRYEIDLGQRPATIAQIGEGTELEELPAEDRLANAVADERGALSLLR